MSHLSIGVFLLIGLLGASQVAGLAPLSGSVQVASAQEGGAVVITEVSFPTEMEAGRTYDLTVTVENRGSETVELWVAYSWDGLEYITVSSTVRAGEARTELIDGVTLREISDDLAVDLRSGSVHEQRALVFPKEGSHPDDRGPLLDERVVRVTIADEVSGGAESPAPEDSQLRTSTPAAQQEFAGDGEQSRAVRNRGFFSNSGREPPFVSNVFNLTVLGFVLSIAGLLYQLFEGR